VLGAEPVVPGVDVAGPLRAVVAVGRLVGADPVGDGVGQGKGLAGLVLAAVGPALAADVVTDGALGDAEGVGNRGVGLPVLPEGLKGHDLLRRELPGHRQALPGLA
jgi:hypothetical protein